MTDQPLQTSLQTSASTRRIIGLTGGIATGKSTVSNYLAERYRLPVLDADVYARQAVEKGSDILSAIARRYGQRILLADGSLNRTALGNIVFQDPAEKKWLEQQIHPFVRAKFQTESDVLSSHETLVYSIPLLFEAKLTHLVTEIWVVACSPSQQLQRLIARNNLSESQAQERVNAQMDLQEKCALADCVLDNSGTKEALFEQIDELMDCAAT
ncbi:MAG: dephospho-CoA kinase [Cyanobacteria bacterium J06607_13]